MHLQRKALKKWTLITLVYGGHSFFWGVMAKGNPVAMVLGLATLILVFSLIESHPSYQARRALKPRMARAMDWGVKFRLLLAGYIIAILVSGGGASAPMYRSLSFLSWPFTGEMLIGIGAMSMTEMLTGVGLTMGTPGQTMQLDQFVATYVTTILTGLAHTIILALICVVAYGVVRLRAKRAQVT